MTHPPQQPLDELQALIARLRVPPSHLRRIKMTADTPSPSEVVAHLCGMATAIREGRADHMGDDCADKINQAAALIDRLSSARSSTVDEATVGWQPIETAPKDGSEVILLSERGSVFSPCVFQPRGVISEDDFWLVWRAMDFDEVPNPTHWMPLPTLPSGVNGGTLCLERGWKGESCS